MQLRRASAVLADPSAVLAFSVACQNGPVERSAFRNSRQNEANTRQAQIEKVKAENRAGFEAMLVDGREKSVRVAWSNNAGDKGIVDDLIGYLLSL